MCVLKMATGTAVAFHSYNTLLLIYISRSLSFYFRRQKLLIHVVHNNRGYCFLQAAVTFWPQSILALSANSSPTHFLLSISPRLWIHISQSEDILSNIGKRLCLFTYSLLLLESLSLASLPELSLFKTQLRYYFLWEHFSSLPDSPCI